MGHIRSPSRPGRVGCYAPWISSIVVVKYFWPANLALVIKEINTWKGGLISKEKTLQWLAKDKGKEWLAEQY